MLRHYLTVTLRALRRQKLYSAINVVGLALGLACCLLLGLFVWDEMTFDRMHVNGDRLYRIARISLTEDGRPDGEDYSPYMPIPAGPALAEDMPEVEAHVRIKRFRLLTRHAEVAAEEDVLFADAALFGAFTFVPRAGDLGSALARRDGAVLSVEAAERYFGTADAVGERFEMRMEDTFYPFVVTAVAEVPPNSSVQFDVVAPFERVNEAYPWMAARADRFNASSTLTYVLLREGADLAAVRARMPAFIERHYGPHIEEMRAEGYWAGAGPPLDYYFQPLRAIHLEPHVFRGIVPPSHPLYAQVLGGIALAVLLIACINFMTLSVGTSARRAREVGVRKAVGAGDGQLVGQFVGEALALSAAALALGAALASAFLPTFNALTGKALSFGQVSWPVVLAAMLGLAAVTGLVAGSYPALLLARLRPVDSLRDRVRLGGSGALARGLVVVQFGLSVFLLAGTLVLGAQMRFVQERDLGYDREQVAVLPIRQVGGAQALERIRARTAGSPAVQSVTGVSNSFGRGNQSYGFHYRGEQLDIVVYRTETDFIETMGMELVAGRDFDPGLATDSTDAVVINEALARALGFADPLGQPIEGFEWGPHVKEPTVVGVVRDFNFQSLHASVEPALFTLDPGEGPGYALVRLAPGRTADGLAALESVWAELAPGLPFDYGWLDDDLAAFYESEARWAQIVRWATLFALLVSCLGLFGLASLAVAHRTREIGIRKVLGASVAGLAALLARGFAGLVAVAVLVAAPLAWWAADRWLETFAYRIELGPGLFLAAGALALALAVLTVSAHTVRAAAADPVRALRSE